jgi:hypothetical protein
MERTAPALPLGTSVLHIGQRLGNSLVHSFLSISPPSLEPVHGEGSLEPVGAPTKALTLDSPRATPATWLRRMWAHPILDSPWPSLGRRVSHDALLLSPSVSPHAPTGGAGGIAISGSKQVIALKLLIEEYLYT